MFDMNPLLVTDYYKTTHHEQYPKRLRRMVSYMTPRMTRIPKQTKLICIGPQAYAQEYLVDYFNRNFFNMPLQEVIDDYKEFLDATLAPNAVDITKVIALHTLGYLPLEMKCIPEGSRVDLHVPMIEVSNTHPDFVWLVNTIETPMSATLWHMMVSANVGYEYRKIVNDAYAISVDDDVPRARALGDFSLRGQESIESGVMSSAAWLLSFLNTATVPAIKYLEKYYACDHKKEPVGFGAISTEHSVMCSNFAIDGDEITQVRRLLTEIYPNQNFSMVSDSYNYWYMVDVILPALKNEILAHNGCISIRGDSGDPVQIVTETVFRLWKLFGGYINKKGFKVLDPHVKAIYGDAITNKRCREIYNILIANGFACNCVSLGVGSLSFQCDVTEGEYGGLTRDTFGIAIKATYAEDENNNPIMIFKNPITDTGNFKKSQKGCCRVIKTEDSFSYIDELNWEESRDTAMRTVFKDGVVYPENFNVIRNRLWNGEF